MHVHALLTSQATQRLLLQTVKASRDINVNPATPSPVSPARAQTLLLLAAQATPSLVAPTRAQTLLLAALTTPSPVAPAHAQTLLFMAALTTPSPVAPARAQTLLLMATPNPVASSNVVKEPHVSPLLLSYPVCW